jgi:hypothetical protein
VSIKRAGSRDRAILWKLVEHLRDESHESTESLPANARGNLYASGARARTYIGAAGRDSSHSSNSSAHPWPDSIPGLGDKKIRALEACHVCGARTWVRYGAVPLCRPCAITGTKPGRHVHKQSRDC